MVIPLQLRLSGLRWRHRPVLATRSCGAALGATSTSATRSAGQTHLVGRPARRALGRLAQPAAVAARPLILPLPTPSAPSRSPSRALPSVRWPRGSPAPEMFQPRTATLIDRYIGANCGGRPRAGRISRLTMSKPDRSAAAAIESLSSSAAGTSPGREIPPACNMPLGYTRTSVGPAVQSRAG